MALKIHRWLGRTKAASGSGAGLVFDQDRPTNFRSRRLQSYFLAALLFVTIVPLALLAALNTWTSVRDREREAGKGLEKAAATVASLTDDYLDNHVRAIRSFALTFREAHGDRARVQQTLDDHHRLNRGFLTMLVADATGNIVAASPPMSPNRAHTNVSDRPYFQKPMRTRAPYISDVFQGRGFGTDIIVAVSAPLEDREGRLVGVAEGSLNLGGFRQSTRNESTMGLEILILDEQDRVVYCSSGRFSSLEDLNDHAFMGELTAAGSAVFKDNSSSSLAAHGRNRVGWRVIASQPLSVIRKEATYTLLRSLSWLIVVSILSFFLAKATAWKITRPLSQLVQRVHNLDLGSMPDSVADSVRHAPAEIVELAAGFDQMAIQLAYTYQDLRQANLELEERVEKRTLQLAQTNASLQAEMADRIQAQETLELRDHAISVAHEGITILDASQAQWPHVYVNSGLARISGYLSKELLGMPYDFLQGPNTDPATAAALRKALEEGHDCTVEILNCKKDGTEFWNRIALTPVANDDGRVTHFIAIQTDITQRRQVERLKTELVSTVSHELRTPLTSLRGFTELMLQRDYPRARQQQYLTIVRQEAIRLGELIDHFLDLQRIESGREVFYFRPADLSSMLTQVRAVFGQTSPQHQVVTEIEPGLPPANLDADRIQQVFSNLVSNAIKFSPRGGTITLAARHLPGRVRCEIRDEGIGIPPEALNRLFTRFFRVDNTETRKIGGTGLGLELVKRIVEKHQGTVGVESKQGVGSTFWFELPVEGPQAEQVRAPAA